MFSQRVYKYIKEENTENLKTVLDSGVPQVIIDHLLSYAIKQGKLESVRVLICYCANLDSYYQANLFNLKNYATRSIRLLINTYILEKNGKRDC